MGAKPKHGIFVGKSKKKLPKIYVTWSMMKQRCYNQNHIGYKIYAGRGIAVCDEWKDNFEQFYNDMNESMVEHIRKYGKRNTTLDRIDNDRGYSKENCRWATRKQQMNNTRLSLTKEEKSLKVQPQLRNKIKVSSEYIKSFYSKRKKTKRILYNSVIKKEIVIKNLDKIHLLSKREKEVIWYRFLKESNSVSSIVEAAQYYGITKQAVSWFCEKAIRKLTK